MHSVCWHRYACPVMMAHSVLYVSGLVTGFAGWLSPVCLMMVAGILYLYR